MEIPPKRDEDGTVLMLESHQYGTGTKTTANRDGACGDPAPSLITVGGAHLQLHPHTSYLTAAESSREHPQQHGLTQQDRSVDPTVRSLNLAHEDAALSYVTAIPGTPAASLSVRSDGMEGDVWKYGYLRKQKHGHKRFFVLRGPSHLGPSRLEYYDSEKKFRNGLRSAAPCTPKRVIYLYQCFTVNKRADAKNKYLIALYTKDEYFAMVAENEQEQEAWYLALSELMSDGRKGDADDLDDGYGTIAPGVVFKEVWQVNVKPKGLGQTKNLTGVYRLCLSTKTLHLVKLNSETPCVNLQLMNIRRCGHSESFFFIEVGRSSSIGPGEIWMQVDDSVVAQNMHETILETMKALKAFAEFRPRSKSQSSGSNPIAFITTRRHLGNLPPSQTGLQRRSRTEIVGTPPSSKSITGNSYRFRTSSEGEGTMSRPYRSVTGSLSHLNSARISLGRQEGSSRYIRPLPCSNYHTRSASLPVSHFPTNSSPVSVSNSTAHGSVSDALTRPSSASICGSPIDGGFISSDEYGSSPCDLRYFRVRSNTPDSLGNTPPIREEYCLSGYMAMNRRCEVMSGADMRDENLCARKLTYSPRPASNSSEATEYQKMNQTTSSLDELVSEASFSSRNSGFTSYSEQYCQLKSLPVNVDSPSKPKDDGYVPMMPGVVPSHETDYMPMQPSAALSPSQLSHRSLQHSDTQGYMMMLPCGSSSPAQMSQPKEGEYMDMSALSHPALNDSFYMQPTPETPKMYSSYFSLPRSYKAPLRKNHSEYVPMSSPAKPICPAEGCISPARDSALSFELRNGSFEEPHLDQQAVRPTRLSLDRQKSGESTEPRGPPSPGEYINIEFRERPSYTPCSLSTDGSPSSLGSNELRRSPLHEDYMTLEMEGRPPKSHSPILSLVAPWNPPSYDRSQSSTSFQRNGGNRLAEDYAKMTFHPGNDRNPTMCQTDIGGSHIQPLPIQVEPKVIRADPQGRRRHSSETFSSSPAVATGSSTLASGPLLGDGTKWQSSASFDSVWLRLDGVASPDTVPLSTPADAVRICRDTPGGYLNGLNYIALDLREDPHASTDVLPPSPPTDLTPQSQRENGAYASIDFTKSEGLAATSED